MSKSTARAMFWLHVTGANGHWSDDASDGRNCMANSLSFTASSGEIQSHPAFFANVKLSILPEYSNRCT